jgi:hypothetical protein
MSCADGPGVACAKGTSLVAAAHTAEISNAAYLKMNKWLVLALAKSFPSRVPGVYELAKVVQILDQLLQFVLFPAASDRIARAELALALAGDMKALLQKARECSRRSASSRDEDLAEIKAAFIIVHRGSGIKKKTKLRFVGGRPCMPRARRA